MRSKIATIIISAMLFSSASPPLYAEVNPYLRITERFMLMGEGYYQSGNMADAIWAFKRVLAIDPENADALRYMKILAERKEAVKRLTEARYGARRQKAMRQAIEKLYKEAGPPKEAVVEEKKGPAEEKSARPAEERPAERRAEEKQVRMKEEFLRRQKKEARRLEEKAKIEAEREAKDKERRLAMEKREKKRARKKAQKEAERRERQRQAQLAEERRAERRAEERQVRMKEELLRRQKKEAPIAKRKEAVPEKRAGKPGEEPPWGGTPREVIVETAELPGFERYFAEGLGYPLNPYMGFAWEVNSVEIARPIESLMDDMKQINTRIDDQVLRDMIRPEFTKLYVAKLKVRYKKNWPVMRFQYFYEETLHKDDTKFGIKDQQIETYSYDIYNTFYNLQDLGSLTWDVWYLRSHMDSHVDPITVPETRDVFALTLSLRPNDNYEIFMGNEWRDVRKSNTVWVSKYKQWETTNEIRVKFPEYKLSLTPGFKFTSQKWRPTADTTTRQYEAYLDLGKDINKRWKYSDKLIYKAIDADTGAFLKYNVKSQSLTTENKLAYEMFKDFYVSTGLDYSTGLSFNKFDNFALLGELKFFKPGVIRVDVGAKYNYYYRFSDWLNNFYFRFHFYD